MQSGWIIPKDFFFPIFLDEFMFLLLHILPVVFTPVDFFTNMARDSLCVLNLFIIIIINSRCY